MSSGLFLNFEHISHFLTLNTFQTFFLTFTCLKPATKTLEKGVKFLLGGHPFSTYAKFSEKLTFLTPWYAHVRARIRGLGMLTFRKILRTYLMEDPLRRSGTGTYHKALHIFFETAFLHNTCEKLLLCF